jgi:predicted nucleotidyltransferase component of viral defense system
MNTELSAMQPYLQQVQLLVQVLPVVFREKDFALKGGTAINLFVRDLPRLSVDIDLVFLPHDERETALPKIKAALDRIADDLRQALPGAEVVRAYQDKEDALRLVVRRGAENIKIELSPVLRGTVLEPQVQGISPLAEEQFGFVQAPLVSLADLYGGKICAALDRQHPRDLFDVRLLLQENGLTDQIRRVALVYILSHPRPVSELLFPNFKDVAGIYRSEFQGMTRQHVSLDDLVAARLELVQRLQAGLTASDKHFLLAFKRGDPDWNRSGFPGIEDLPALRWKQRNLERMGLAKRRQAVSRLEGLLAEVGAKT